MKAVNSRAVSQLSVMGKGLYLNFGGIKKEDRQKNSEVADNPYGEMHLQTGVKDTMYMKCSGDKKELIESRFGAVVRKLTFHPCGLGSILSLTPYTWVEFVDSLL